MTETAKPDPSTNYMLAMALVLSAVLLSASIFMSIGGLTEVILKKDFKPVVQAGGSAAPAPDSGTPSGTAPPAPDTTTPIPLAVDLTGQPQKGGSGAKAEMAIFSDFECPYCERAFPSEQNMEKAYGDKLRVTFFNFPLSFHPNAQKAAEGAECAFDQNKFWEYHDLLFTARKLTVPELKAQAKTLGMDSAKFDACLDSGSKANAVSADMAVATNVGVSGTPSYLIFAPAKSEASLSKLQAVSANFDRTYYGGQHQAIVVEVSGKGYGLFFAGALPDDAFKQAIDATSG